MKKSVELKTIGAAMMGASMLLACPVQAELLSFTGARDSGLPLDQFNSNNYTYTQSQSITDTGISTVSIASGEAKSQTFYGVNKVAVENTVYVTDESLRQNSIGGPFAVGISVWVDQFTITGGVGAGSATVSAAVTGQFGPKPDPSYGGGGIYSLFVASRTQIDSLLARPFEFVVNPDVTLPVLELEQNVPNPFFVERNPVPPGSPFGGMLVGDLPFTYGVPFYLVGLLAGFANDYGILDAFNTANFGITVSTGSVIRTASGTTYAPAAVPEPGTVALVVLALLGIAVSGARGRIGARG